MSTKVPVPRSLLIGLVGVATAAVLGVAFLLGRASAPAPFRESQPPAPDPRILAPAQTEPASPLPAPDSGQPAEPFPALRPVPAMPPAARAVAEPASPAGDEAERPRVAAYFKAVEAIQPQQSGEPEAVAQQLMLGFGKGDTGGFDGMVKEAQATRDRLAGLAPPPACAAYHQESLAVLDASLDLMAGIKRTLAASDPSAPGPDFTTRATALKARSEALQARERALRQRFHLETKP